MKCTYNDLCPECGKTMSQEPNELRIEKCSSCDFEYQHCDDCIDDDEHVENRGSGSIYYP
ncbi:MAG: hypothetical protein GY853_15590 [PVC group bacterium]|nr:hypothetical protein [PVC group bacterium]